MEALAPQPEEVRIRKTTYDPFFRTDLGRVLAGWGTEHLVVVGTVANICVLHGAAGAALRGIRPVVPGDGVSALTSFGFYLAFFQLTSLYRGLAVRSGDGVGFTG